MSMSEDVLAYGIPITFVQVTIFLLILIPVYFIIINIDIHKKKKIDKVYEDKESLKQFIRRIDKETENNLDE